MMSCSVSLPGSCGRTRVGAARATATRRRFRRLASTAAGDHSRPACGFHSAGASAGTDARRDGVAGKRAAGIGATHPRYPFAARQPARHLAAEVGAGGPGLPLSATGCLQAHRQVAGRTSRRSRSVYPRNLGGAGRCAERTRIFVPIWRGVPSTSSPSGKRCNARRWNFPIFTTFARCACWSTTSPTATPRSAWCTRCGRICRANSTTT